MRSVLHRHWLAGVRLAVVGAALTACAPGEEPPTVASATANATTPTPQTFVVESARDSIDHGNVVLLALSFAEPRRVLEAGDLQLDSVHPLPGSMTGCIPANARAYEAAMGPLHPQDTGTVTTMRVELSNRTSAPDAASRMCFAVHTRAAGWTWHWDPIPITIDFGESTFTGEPGAGHFDLAVNTADVDMIALSMAYGREALTKVTYSAIPAPR